MSQQLKIFISEPNDFSGESYKMLERAGFEVIMGVSRFQETKEGFYSEDDLIRICQDVNAVICASRESFTARLIASCPKLAVIAKVGIGTEKIDAAAATQNGVLVTFTPVRGTVINVAEHAVTLMLSLLRRVRFMEDRIRSGQWKGPETLVSRLFGKTIGIVGYGRIGRRLRQILTPWDVKFLIHDPYLPADVAASLGDELVSLDELMKRADIVSLHVVITPETTNIINARTLALMKPTAFLINTARGQAVDEAALVEALQKRQIAGAGIDVFSLEPPPADSPLYGLDNVVLTPHVSGYVLEIQNERWQMAAQSVIDALFGKVPVSVKNPDVVPAWQQRIGGILG